MENIFIFDLEGRGIRPIKIKTSYWYTEKK